MAQFVHPFWSVVGRNYASLEQNAPDGFHSIVDGKDDASAPRPSDRYVFVDESRIARVEIRYVRKDEATTGFSLRAVSDDGQATVN